MSERFDGKIEPLMTAQEVADRLGWHINTVYNRVHKRAIPFVKIGRSVRFRPADIEQWIITETARAGGPDSGNVDKAA